MDDYNSYVTAVNKIFDYLEKMKAGWDSQDNKNYISSIEEYKNAVISKAAEMKKPPKVQPKPAESTATPQEGSAEAATSTEATTPAEFKNVEALGQ